MKKRSFEMTFDSRYQEGEEGLQDNVGVGNASGEGYTAYSHAHSIMHNKFAG